MDSKVIQLLPSIAYGDAVSNDTLGISDVLTNMRIKNEIYAINIDSRVSKRASQVNKLKTRDNDIIIYHMSTGSRLSQIVHDLPNKKKIMIYHNITPAEYFLEYNRTLYDLCSLGRQQLKTLSDSFLMSLADSSYNKAELEHLGFRNVHVRPVIINFSEYSNEPDLKIIERFKDDYVNILFIGRIAPNKKQEDIIKSYYIYKKYINQKSRLFLVGSHIGMERYLQTLNQLVTDLDLKDVYIPGHSSFKEILAYYRIASVFLCMSEHEGFCVPLAESMLFKVPIIAYEAAAIPETLGKSGIMIREKKYEVIAETINMIVKNRELREKVIKAQTERLKAFDADKIINQLYMYIRQII